MTSFLAWLSVDERRPSALYFASDSRRSWPDGRTRDDCIKLFASKTSADIFAFVGDDITYPERMLPELCKELDDGLVPAGQMTSMYGRNEWVSTQLAVRMPKQDSHRSFTVFHGSRNSFGMCATFQVIEHSYFGKTMEWKRTELITPLNKSGAVTVGGSGAENLDGNVQSWVRHLGQFSRSFFSAFCDALTTASDPLSGGAPQLLGFGNTGNPIHFGIVTKVGAFYRGEFAEEVPEGTKWRNELFECVNRQGNLFKKAQHHARPKSI